MREKHGEVGVKACQSDIINHLLYLKQAAELSSPETYREYISWNKTLFKNLNISDHGLLAALKVINLHLSEEPNMQEILSQIIIDYEDIPLHNPPESSDKNLEEHSERYLNYLLSGEREKAFNLILDLHAKGLSLQTIYIEILQAVQYQVGYLWHTNKVSVAQEHYITQATRLLMTKLYHQNIRASKNKGKILATCAPGEQHDMGLRMVADLLELDGWNVSYLGPNTPEVSIIDYIKDEKPDLVAISVTIPTHIEATKQLIMKIKQEYNQIKIITGGYSFIHKRDLWQQIESDGFAENAVDAITLVNDLM
jgi:methanogenic corrinoid protein MtbC1